MKATKKELERALEMACFKLAGMWVVNCPKEGMKCPKNITPKPTCPICWQAHFIRKAKEAK